MKVDATHMVDVALSYAKRGWFVFPTPGDGSKMGCTSGDKSNGRRWGCTTDLDAIMNYFTKKFRTASIGIAMEESGLFVVEADTVEGHDVDGIAALRELEAKHGTLPATLIAESPSGSLHYYFKQPEGSLVTSSTSALAIGVDVKGAGGMVMAPPSRRPGKGCYRWLNDNEVAEPPQWLINLCRIEQPRERNPFADASTYPRPDPAELAAAMAVIPNADLGWAEWNKIGMALWDATGGSDEGLAAFIAFSKKSSKYKKDDKKDDPAPKERWDAYRRSPPKDRPNRDSRKVTAGTIFAKANEANPNWRQALPAPAQPAVKPVDLWASFNAPKLLRGLLPPVIEKFAVAQAAMMGCDAGGLAMAALAVCAAAIPDTTVLQVKRHDPSWLESARIWVALVGDPSTKKSPIIRTAARPLIQLDRQLYAEYLAALEVYEAKTDEAKKQTRPPKHKRLRLEDTTIEASQTVLMDNPDGMLCLQDELSGWIGAMDKYSGSRGSAKDRGYWLQSFNGGAYVVDRIGRKSGVIENLSVCLLGGVQPEPLRKIAAAAVDDGLLQRLFTIVLPPATQGRDEPQLTEVEDYHGLVGRLRVYGDNAFAEYGRTVTKPEPLRFDEGAQKLRDTLEAKHLELQQYEEINRKLSAHVGKFDGLFARLCVLWHVVEDGKKVVTLNTAKRVAEFMHEYLLPHAVAFYAGILGLSDEHDRLSAIAGYILARRLDQITTRDVQRGDRTMRGLTKHDTDNVFEQLEALGWVSQVPGPRRDSPPQWVVNPEVHVLFAARAKAEAVRRAAVRKAVGMLLGGDDDA